MQTNCKLKIACCYGLRTLVKICRLTQIKISWSAHLCWQTWHRLHLRGSGIVSLAQLLSCLDSHPWSSLVLLPWVAPGMPEEQIIWQVESQTVD